MKRVFIGFCAACALSLGAAPAVAEKKLSATAAQTQSELEALAPSAEEEAGKEGDVKT